MKLPQKPQLSALLVLTLVAACIFYQSFKPNLVLRANDIPVAAASARFNNDISTLSGAWNDLNWLGISYGSRPLALTTFSLFLLGPIGQAKFAGMLAMLLVGIGGWWCFSRMKLAPAVSLLGGLALMLNMLVFSFSAWGVYIWNFALAFLLIALGIIHQGRNRGKDLAAIGLCAGMCVNEGIDVGAIMAMVIGVYFIFRNWQSSVKSLLASAARLIVIVALALLVSANWVSSLLETYVSGVVKEQMNEQDRREQWLFITQWSLPKKEVAALLVPGLFGYRMDTPEGGNYWGEVGRDPNWKPGQQQGGGRYTGSGQYTGKAVLLLALITAVWAFLPMARNLNSQTPSQFQRREVIFWIMVCLVCLSFSFGKHFVTYSLIYPLPFFHSMRNPVKFMPIVMVGLVILSVHGLQLFVQPLDQLRNKLLSKVTIGVCAALVLVNFLLLIGWSSGRNRLLGYLTENDFSPGMAQAILKFGQNEIAVSLVLLILTVGAVLFCLRGRNKTIGFIVLGAVLVFDLGYADTYWKEYYNYKQRYESNPIVDFLRQSPEQHRVAGPKKYSGSYYLMALQNPNPDWQQFVEGISSLYDVEWLQHLFQYYNIQSPDIVQWPRMPIVDRKFASAFAPRVTPPRSVFLNLQPRFWQLTSTRYLLASPPAAQALNGAFGAHYHFEVIKHFSIARNGDQYTAVETTNGPLALIEFTNALPRVGFYSQWRTEPDEDKMLQIISGEDFNPAKEVVVGAKEIPGFKSGATGAASEVRMTSYAPKKSVINVTNAAPGVLLINSRYDPNWKIRVDGQNQPLLRCNFLMSGVALSTGKHEVVFEYSPATPLFYANVIAIGTLVLFLVVPFGSRKEKSPTKPVAV